ncbi:hypothetical protein [Bradyrhizobium sp.]|uniref:hypothetical protein n=1 Tax=Bradyrhizobium sp. TaxID=376 RepID=UPI004037A62E
MSLWRTRQNPLAWWWAMLTLVSTVNIVLWLLLYRELRAQPVGSMELMLLLCGTYVFGCAFRSVLPRADVQRICLFDTWLSSVLVGRSVATVAEVCFVLQWAIILQQLGTITGSDTVLHVAWIIVPLILIAECFSWYAVVTTNFLYNAIENSLWAVAFLLVGIGLVRLLPEFHGAARIVLVLSIAGIVGYLAFLMTVDVPMYFSRWRANVAEGNQLLGLLEGLRDVSTRWIKTHDIAHWKGEIAWMSLYFSGAVWASLALCVFYSLEGELPHYRTETAALGAPVQQAGTTPVGVAPVARRSEAAVRAAASPF